MTARADDTTPVGWYDDGCPRYAPSDVDARFDALLSRYRFTLGDPDSDRMAVANAFCAVTASENLAHADEAVEMLRVVLGHNHGHGFLQLAPVVMLLGRYEDDGLNSDRKDITRGFAVVAASENRAHADEAVDVLDAMVGQAKRRIEHLERHRKVS